MGTCPGCVVGRLSSREAVSSGEICVRRVDRSLFFRSISLSLIEVGQARLVGQTLIKQELDVVRLEGRRG